ncbi:uncharacterized protein LOC143600944 [Bidens hawaiensis]|uniref:uncharacterized protein LOC143600944 n=1 Tax=Bidens hawaiensis TaxID=980011 RepID=UPI004049388A
MGAMVKLLMLVAVVTTVAMGGVVYKVGDEVGWTNIAYVNYKTWASSKSFRVGDTILFSYNQIFHNVVRVSYADYVSCNVTTAHETFTSGEDKFLIKYPGHYFFICTSPDHCKVGQKVDIRVPVSGSHSAPSPTAADSPTPIQPLPFPYPQPFAPAPAPTPAKTLVTSPAKSPEITPAKSPANTLVTPPAKSPVTTPATPPAKSPVTTPATTPAAPLQPPPAPKAPAPSVTGDSPAPAPAPEGTQKSTGSQLGFGFKVCMMMMAVMLYFGF